MPANIGLLLENGANGHSTYYQEGKDMFGMNLRPPSSISESRPVGQSIYGYTIQDR